MSKKLLPPQASPAASNIKPMAQYKYSQHTLSNGLRVLFLPYPTAASVFVSMLGKVGRRVERDNEIGAAHFLEHLFFDGTKKRPTPTQVSEFMENYGGQKNGVTGAEHVEYYAKILPEHCEVAFDFLSDILHNSLLEGIDKERKVIAQEAATVRDDPMSTLSRQRLATLYPGQTVGRTILDEEPKLKDVNREMLLGYMRRTYNASNFILSIAGSIKEGEALTLAEKYFGSFPKGPEAEFEQAKLAEGQVITIDNKDLTQSKLSISFRGFTYGSKELIIAQLLAMILSQGSSSRLNDRLRHQLHLVYSVWAGNNSLIDTGVFIIQTMMEEKSLQKTIDEIFKEIRRLLKDGVTGEELDKVKNKFLASLLFGLEDLDSCAGYFADQWLFLGKITEVDERIKQIKAVTREDILKVAQYIFAGNPKINILTNKLKKVTVPAIKF